MKSGLFTLIAVATLLATLSAQGDTLILHDGDRLSGDLVEIAGGILTFRTVLAGKLIVPVEDVKWVTTESFVDIHLDDGTNIIGKLVVKEGAIRVVSQNTGMECRLDLATVARAAPAPANPQESAKSEVELRPSPWLGAWELGMRRRDGHRDYAALFGKLTLLREEEVVRQVLSASIEFEEEETFPSFLQASGEWRLRPYRQAYPLFSLDIERDKSRGLALRGDFSVGFGRDFLQSHIQQIEADAGLNLTLQYYDADLIWPDHKENTFARLPRYRRLLGTAFPKTWALAYYADEEMRRQEQDIRLRLHLRYTRGLFLNSTLAEELLAYPSLTDFGEIWARSESSILFPLTPGLKLKLHLTVDFESDPEFDGLDEWRSAVGASIVWDFDRTR